MNSHCPNLLKRVCAATRRSNRYSILSSQNFKMESCLASNIHSNNMLYLSKRNFASLSQKIKMLRKATNAPMMECKKALTNSNEDMDLALELLRKQGSAKASNKVAGREANEGLIGLVIDDEASNGALVKISSETDFASRSSEFCKIVAYVADKAMMLRSNDVDILKQDRGIMKKMEVAVLAIRENLDIVDVRPINSSTNILAGYVHGKSPHSSDAGSAAALLELAWLKETGDKAIAEEAGKRLAMHIVATKPQYLSSEDIPDEVLCKEKSLLLEQLNESGATNNKPKEIVNKIVNGKLNKYFSEVCLIDQPHVVEEKSPPVKKVLEGLGLKVTRFEYMSIV